MAQASVPMGPFCQSCGMPLSSPEDFGTSAQGFRQNDYCHLCYENGVFRNPDATMEQMLQFAPDAEARAWMEQNLPFLKRWQNA